MTIKSNAHKFQPGEFRTRYLKLEDIHTETLKYRAENGVRNTLVQATANAGLVASAAAPYPACGVLKLDTKHLLSAVNYSASQSRKELSRRGVKLK